MAFRFTRRIQTTFLALKKIVQKIGEIFTKLVKFR